MSCMTGCSLLTVHNVGFPKPDFIVHVPGMHNNCAVIEVKGPNASPAGICKDLCKLLLINVRRNFTIIQSRLSFLSR